jgi:hypothetical protein
MPQDEEFGEIIDAEADEAEPLDEQLEPEDGEALTPVDSDGADDVNVDEGPLDAEPERAAVAATASDDDAAGGDGDADSEGAAEVPAAAEAPKKRAPRAKKPAAKRPTRKKAAE